jgi:hypothetical protein
MHSIHSTQDTAAKAMRLMDARPDFADWKAQRTVTHQERMWFEKEHVELSWVNMLLSHANEQKDQDQQHSTLVIR